MFSVVVPLFNKEPHVARAIQSVLDQTYTEWELIVVDDGSTDGGPSVVQGYHDSRIRYIRQENQGPSEARNRGIDEARFTHIAFLDADDEWLPRHLESMFRLIQHFPNAAIYAQAYHVRNGDRVDRPRFHRVPSPPWEGLIANYFISAKPGVLPVWTSATVIPKAVLARIGGFPRNVPRGQDLECWSLAALEGPVAFSQEIGAVYYKDTVNRHDKRRRLLDRKLGVEIVLEQGLVPAHLITGVKLYIQRLYVRRYEALIKAGEAMRSEVLRKTLGRPLSWDTFWRLLILDLRRAVPFSIIRHFRKMRGS